MEVHRTWLSDQMHRNTAEFLGQMLQDKAALGERLARPDGVLGEPLETLES